MNCFPDQYVQCEQKSGVLKFTHARCYESRGISVEKMIRDCIARFNIQQDFNFIVNTDDVPRGRLDHVPIFHFCNAENFDSLFPDFFYESWPEIKVKSSSDETAALRHLNELPSTNKIGWIGTLLCDKRREIYNTFCSDERFEILPIEWKRQADGTLNASNYMSYYEQYKKWRFFLDIEGGGWSARLKTLLTIPRVTFVVDRKWKDWCWNFLKPWEHFVPIKNDLSDLDCNYKKIINDPDLELHILNENKKLYDVCLSYDSAISQINNLICNLK